MMYSAAIKTEVMVVTVICEYPNFFADRVHACIACYLIIWTSLDYCVTDVQEANVLVNIITSKTPDLLRAGVIAAAFLDAAGDELQDVRISLLFVVVMVRLW